MQTQDKNLPVDIGIEKKAEKKLLTDFLAFLLILTRCI
jgi:hypothetical protein